MQSPLSDLVRYILQDWAYAPNAHCHRLGQSLSRLNPDQKVRIVQGAQAVLLSAYPPHSPAIGEALVAFALVGARDLGWQEAGGFDVSRAINRLQLSEYAPWRALSVRFDTIARKAA